MTATNPQDRDAWIAKRRGKITASRVGDLVRRKKNGEMLKAGIDYMYEVLVERLTGQATEHYVSGPMQWGLDQEANAVAYYEFEKGVTCAFSDFVEHPGIEGTGASPDRLIGDDGLLEVKCPITRNHISFLLDGDIEALGENYPWQIQWQLACTARKWCDFMVFDPRLPVHLQARIVRVERDEAMIDEAREAVCNALEEIKRLEARLAEASNV